MSFFGPAAIVVGLLIVLSAVSLVRGTAKQGIIVGITLTLLIFTYGPISGGSMKPFRSLAPALGAGYFEGQYVYLTGTPVGAAIAGALYRFIEKAGRGPS